MINISGEMRQLIDNAYADGFPCVLGTATKDGAPQISLKGSVLVLTGKPWPTGNAPSGRLWRTWPKILRWLSCTTIRKGESVGVSTAQPPLTRKELSEIM